MTYTTEKKTCPRCRGTGMTGHVVVYNGWPGTCFKCAGEGQVYKDAFYQAFGVGKRFWGVTMVVRYPNDNPNNGTFKLLATKWDPENVACDRVTTITAVEITEEQARHFWTKYGKHTINGKVRVSGPAAA